MNALIGEVLQRLERGDSVAQVSDYTGLTPQQVRIVVRAVKTCALPGCERPAKRGHPCLECRQLFGSMLSLGEPLTVDELVMRDLAQAKAILNQRAVRLQHARQEAAAEALATQPAWKRAASEAAA